MSFLGELVDSIGSGKAPTPPKPLVRPINVNTQRLTPNTGKTGTRADVLPKPSPLNGTKRKAEDDSPKVVEKHVRPNPAPGISSTVNRRVAAPPLNAPKPSLDKPAATALKTKLDTTIKTVKPGSTPPVTPTTSGTPTTSIAKPPAKGSYADIMARAKQAQEAKSQTQVGMIKHQSTNREKVSKLAERRKQEEEKAKAAKEKHTERLAKAGKSDKGRSVSPAKKSDQPRVAKVARPPLHAPAAAYRGTMGTSTTKPRLPPSRKKSRYDEYLGTDEEEDSEIDEDEGDYGSDASSDMEAGAFDIDEEERIAMKAAREDDARELAEEMRLKREKEERRKRLANLAGRRK